MGHSPVGHILRRMMHMLIIRPAPDPDPPQYDVKIKVRSTGRVVHSVRRDAGVPANEAMSEIEADLDALALEAFCKKYGFAAPR